MFIVAGCARWQVDSSRYKNTNTKYTNTQIHKYKNTAYDEVPEGPNMWYIFEKGIVKGYHQKWESHVSNT